MSCRAELARRRSMSTCVNIVQAGTIGGQRGAHRRLDLMRLLAGERVLELALVHVRTSFDVAALRLGVQLFLCVSGRTGV